MIGFLAGLMCFLLFGCAGVKAPKGVDSPPHHTSRGFQNLHGPSERRFGGFLRWRLGLGPKEAPIVPPEELPVYAPEIIQPENPRIQHADADQIQITWIGHATFLIQVEGMNLLTDPVFSERCSPVFFFGGKRLAPPGVPFEKLPPIDGVLVSHNHYDHLDANTLARLGNRPTYFVPLGLKEWFEKRGIKNLVELDWWKCSPFRSLQIHAVPIQHFSGRSPFDRNRTLWAGWVVESKVGRIFFAGDTGYSPVFEEIGNRFGPLKVSMIPIGAYRPRWFMTPVHVDPPEAIRILKDTRSVRALAMHWGTFTLSDEPPGEPPVYLRKALMEKGVSEEQFIIMKFGQTLSFH